jgi:hypothetical protein
VLSDDNNCGSCGHHCDTITGYFCTAGSCICDTCT